MIGVCTVCLGLFANQLVIKIFTIISIICSNLIRIGYTLLSINLANPSTQATSLLSSSVS